MRIWDRADWIRTVYYDRLGTVCKALFAGGPSLTLRTLEYAECAGVIPRIISEFATVHLTCAPYPKYDIQEDQFPNNEFDVVIADQVLEHVPHVMKAVKNCVRMCKPGGILIFGTPWVYPYHAAPKDYWRISRDAYQMMFDEFGVETIEIGGWGHKEALIFGNQTDGFLTTNRTVEQALKAGLFDIPNDSDHAIEVWAVGRKR